MDDIFFKRKKWIIYPIILVITISLIFFANIFKSNTLGVASYDFMPEIFQGSHKERINKVEEKSIEIALSNKQQVVQRKQNPRFDVTQYIASCRSVSCFTDIDAGRGVVQYKTSYFYAHSSLAFNRLKTVYVGDVIEIKDKDGKIRTYKIQKRIVEKLEYLNGEGKRDGFTSGIYAGKYYGTQYSASFMTCGNGSNNDSNYRLILFGTEI